MYMLIFLFAAAVLNMPRNIYHIILKTRNIIAERFVQIEGRMVVANIQIRK